MRSTTWNCCGNKSPGKAHESSEVTPPRHWRARTRAGIDILFPRMGIVKNIAAIAKGMSVTFGEMFKPTEVENYPDGPGPNRGAMFQERFRGMHVLQRDENGLEKCVACFLCAAACPSNCIYIEAAENYRDEPDQRRRALRQGLQHRLQPLHLLRLTAWKPARPMRSPTGTASSWPASTRAIWFTARSSCWRGLRRTKDRMRFTVSRAPAGWCRIPHR